MPHAYRKTPNRIGVDCAPVSNDSHDALTCTQVIDLHVHSCRSDGTDSPTRLVELAADAGCSAFALTDHDTVGGIAEATKAATAVGIEVISGVELSCHVGDRNVHLLGYFVDPDDATFLSFLARQRNLRDERNGILIEKLGAIGVHLTIEDVKRESIGESVGRPHFAAALVRNGDAASVEDAFLRFLGAEAPTHVVRRDLPAEDAIAAIKTAGGVTSWAHPLTGRATGNVSFDSCLNALLRAGLDGLESWYSTYTTDDRAHLATVAARNSLVATGGSDYHGTFKPALSLAKGAGDLRVPQSALDELRAARH